LEQRVQYIMCINLKNCRIEERKILKTETYEIRLRADLKKPPVINNMVKYEMGCGYMDWIGLAQDRDRWRTLVGAVMNLRFP